jgi:hypothetical protein
MTRRGAGVPFSINKCCIVTNSFVGGEALAIFGHLGCAVWDFGRIDQSFCKFESVLQAHQDPSGS